MKIAILAASIFTALGTSAQLVSFVTPTPNSHIVAGQPFNATAAFADTTSSVNVVALFFGVKNEQGQSADLGQTKMATVTEPQFTSGPGGRMVHNVMLTFPTNMINGLDRMYNLTMGEFYTLGAENTPKTHTVQVPVFIASA